MAKHPLSVRAEQQDLSRRALIKWTVAAGAALGVSRSRIFEILAGTAGKDVAFAASANPTCRSVHCVMGNGGLAWTRQLWPDVDIALANNPNLAYAYPGSAALISGTVKPLAGGTATPWKDLPAARQVTGFVCGNNETHTQNPGSVEDLNGQNIFSIASALQSVSPSVVPFISIDSTVGAAQGGQQPAAVNDANAIVGLFNSAASRAGGLLQNPANATLYKASFDAFAQLNRAANRPTTRAAYNTGSSAAGFLGKNLAAELAIQPTDLMRYGITGNTRGNVAAIGQTLIVAIKAFKLGLTNSIVFPGMRDDPHGAFADGSAATVPMQLKTVLDAFMLDLTNTVDDNTGETLADSTVITFHGDTPKSATDPGGWPDGTSNNHNRVIVYSAGHIKSGWFGEVKRDDSVRGFDGTGSLVNYNGGAAAKFGLAAIAYAIAKRDDRAISAFANGINITGLVNPKVT